MQSERMAHPESRVSRWPMGLGQGSMFQVGVGPKEPDVAGVERLCTC